MRFSAQQTAQITLSRGEQYLLPFLAEQKPHLATMQPPS
jgi:hypothetical protein